MPKLNLIDILKNTILEQAPIGMSSDYGEDSKFYTTDTKGKVIPLVQPEVQKDTDVVDNSDFPGIPGEWVKLAKLIASKESSSYTSLNPNTTLEKKGLVNATSKTFKEVQDFLTQKGISDNAVGRWQFKNLLDKVKGAGLSETDLFNPTNQNKLFMYLVNNKRSVTIDSIKKDLYGSAKRLAMEWSSLPVLQDTTGNSGSVKRGDSYYSGKASINADEFESVLKDISNSTEESKDSKQLTSKQKSFIGIAKKYIGTPYKWGGSSPNGFDCSGFVNYVYKEYSGTDNFPRTAANLYKKSEKVNKENLKPGDLVFFDDTRLGFGVMDHVGIIISPEGSKSIDFIHAGSSTGVTIIKDLLSNSYYSKKIGGYGRYNIGID